MSSLLSPSRTNMFRRQYNSAIRIKGMLFPISQRTLSTANVKFVEQKNKYGGMLSKLKKIFRQPEKKYQEVELLPVCSAKYKKRQRTQNRPLRKILAYHSKETNILGNYYDSCLRCVRIDELLSDCKLALVMPKKKTNLLSFGSVRGIMGLASFNSKPPITEPNMPQQQERKDKKDEKKNKKPVIKVDGKSTPELEKDLLGLEPENYRYQWGVKLIDPIDSEKTTPQESKSPKYILKNSWGVRMKVLDPEIKDAAKPAQAAKIEEIANLEEVAKIEEVDKILETTIIKDAKIEEGINLKEAKFEENTVKIEALKTQEDLNKSPPKVEDQPKIVSPEVDAKIGFLNKDQSASFTEETASEGDLNVPKELPQNAEMIAWQDLANRAKSPAEKAIEDKQVYDPLGQMLIRTKPQNSKLSVEAGKPGNSEMKGIRNMESKKLNDPKAVDYASNKKIHTDSRSCASAVGGRSSEMNISKSCLLMNANADKINKLVDPFLIPETKIKSGMEAAKGISLGKGDKKKELKMAHVKRGIKNSRRRPLLPTKVLTLTRINTDDMSYYDDLDAKNVDEIYGRNVEIELSSPNVIGDNILDAPLPTEISISTKPSSKKRVDSIVWVPFVYAKRCSARNSSSYSGGYVFGGSSSGANGSSNGSSGSKGRKYFATSMDETKGKGKKPALRFPEDVASEDEPTDYGYEEDYVRVPGDPYPYSREHFYKWRVARQADSSFNSISKRANEMIIRESNVEGGHSTGDYNVSGGHNNLVGDYDFGDENRMEGYSPKNKKSTEGYNFREFNTESISPVEGYREEYKEAGDFSDEKYNTVGISPEGSYNTESNYNTEGGQNMANYYNQASRNEASEISNYEAEGFEEEENQYSNRQNYDFEEEEDNRDVQLAGNRRNASTNRNVFKPKLTNRRTNQDVATTQVQKEEFYDDDKYERSAELAGNAELDENLEAGKGLQMSRKVETRNSDAGDETGSSAEEMRGSEVQQTVYGRHNQNLYRQLNTIDKDDGWKFERMQFYKEKEKTNVKVEPNLKNHNEHPWAISEEKSNQNQSNNATAVEETEAIRGRTIHPEVALQKIANEKSIVTKLRDQVSEFVKKGNSTELSKAGPEPLQDSIYNIRYREMKLSKEDMDQIHEMKNYAYLRFDKLKDTLTPLIDRKKKKDKNSPMF